MNIKTANTENEIIVEEQDKQKLADHLVKQFNERMFPNMSVGTFINQMVVLGLNEYINLSDLGIAEEI